MYTGANRQMSRFWYPQLIAELLHCLLRSAENTFYVLTLAHPDYMRIPLPMSVVKSFSITSSGVAPSPAPSNVGVTSESAPAPVANVDAPPSPHSGGQATHMCGVLAMALLRALLLV